MQNQKAVTLEQVLQNVSAQLDTLRKHAAELEETVSRVIDQNSETSGALIYEMQALDAVNQGLQDMATLTGLLAHSTGSQTVSTDQTEKICKTVRLTTTRTLLFATAPHTCAPEKASAPSDLHLF